MGHSRSVLIGVCCGFPSCGFVARSLRYGGMSLVGGRLRRCGCRTDMGCVFRRRCGALGVDCRCTGCGSRDRLICGPAPCHAYQTAFEKAAGRCSSGAAAFMSGTRAKGMPHGPGNRTDSSGCDQCLGQHGAAGVSNIDAQTGQKTVDFLRSFEKANGTQKPNQYIPCYRFPANRIYLCLHISLADSKCRHCE